MLARSTSRRSCRSPFIEHPGSGIRTCRCSRGEENAFFSRRSVSLVHDGAPVHCGLLAHAEEIAAITNQHVNSTSAHGGEAPSYVCWGHLTASGPRARSPYQAEGGLPRRVEYRAPDPSANPYLARSPASLRDLTASKEDGTHARGRDNVRDPSDRERQVMGRSRLAGLVVGRRAGHEELRFAASTLGEQVFDHVILA